MTTITEETKFYFNFISKFYPNFFKVNSVGIEHLKQIEFTYKGINFIFKNFQIIHHDLSISYEEFFFKIKEYYTIIESIEEFSDKKYFSVLWKEKDSDDFNYMKDITRIFVMKRLFKRLQEETLLENILITN